MAIPKPQPKDWLKAAADELRLGDRATIKLLQESYRHVNEILKTLPDTPDAAFGNLIYRAQLERTRKALLDEQSKLFDRLGDTVGARRVRSASRAAKLSAASNAAYLRLVGEGPLGQKLYDSATITAQRTVDTILARTQLSKVPLAERIYKTAAWMDGRLDRLITQTMATGLNAKRFAKVARDWFSPSTPGGTRYAAMRLARSEINNAFHATTLDYASSKPWVGEMEWHLSHSHPKLDECNPIAAASPYPVAEVPRKPHPQCMCYITEKAVDEDEWIDRFIAGEFDEYLNNELGIAESPVDKGVQSATGKPIQKAKAAPGLKTGSQRPATPDNINAASKAVFEQLEPGAKLEVIGRPDLGIFEVDHFKGKSVYFTNGKLENFRGLYNWRVLSEAPQRSFAERVTDAASGKQALLTAHYGLDRKLGSPGYSRMTESMRTGVNKYTSSFYKTINRYLRQGDFEFPEDREEALRFIAGIDEAMAGPGLSAEALTYRAMHNAQLIFGNRIDGDLTGLEWQEQAYTSTTASGRITKTFISGPSAPNRVLIRILVPKGTKAVEASGISTEAELLLARGTKYRIIADHGVNDRGIRNLDVEVFND